MKIFLLGGTKDSINIIQYVKDNYDAYILTTTTTEYGAKLAREGGSDDTIARPLLKDEIIKIITENGFDILIDATHPFASHITQTSSSIAQELNLPYIRFERPTTDLSNIETSHIHYVTSFDEAGKLIENEFANGNVLHFAGANTVASSIEKCEKLGVNPDHIIAMNGAASLEENISLIEKYDASVMITKESGEVGGVIEKIQAADEKNVAVVMIQRPKIDGLNKNDIVSNLNELDGKLKSFF